MTDASIIETLQKVSESPAYYEALSYELTVEARPLAQAAAEPETYTFDLSDAFVGSAFDGRVVEVVKSNPHGESLKLFIEADHRGAEHGVDAWVGHGEPEATVLTIEASGVDTDA